MDQRSKPREFWLVNDWDNFMYVFGATIEMLKEEPQNKIHVIEYSAYEALERQVQHWSSRYDLLFAENERLKAALADIKALLDHPFDSDTTRLMQIRNRL